MRTRIWLVLWFSFPPLLAAACHEGTAGSPDAPPTPGASDAAPADAAPPDAIPPDAAPDAMIPVCPAGTHPAAPTGMYSHPGDFDRQGCKPGTLARIDLNGVWQGQASTFRVAANGLCLSDVISESAPAAASLTDTDLIIQTAPTFSGETSFLDVCNVRGDGKLLVKQVRCQRSAGPTPFCFEPEDDYQARLSPLPGETDGSGLTLLARWSGGANPWPDSYTANVRVAAGVAYVARWDGLYIVDVSDPTAPRDLAQVLDPNDYANDLKLVTRADGHRFVLLASNNGFKPIDVTDPARPIVAPLPIALPPTHTLFVDGARLYLADGSSDHLSVVDVRDPAAPTLVGTYQAPDPLGMIGFHDLFVASGRAYLNGEQGGLLVVDLADDPAKWVLRGTFLDGPDLKFSHSNWVTTAGGRTISVDGDEGYDAHAHVVDVDPASASFMKELGGYQTRPEVSIHNIMAIGERAYVAYYQDGLRVLDLHDPTHPTLAAYYNTWSEAVSSARFFEGAFSVDVDPIRHLVYVADTPGGLVILKEAP